MLFSMALVCISVMLYLDFDYCGLTEFYIKWVPSNPNS